MPVKLAISGVAKETGALLKEYLEEAGVYRDTAPATVCYGRIGATQYALNANCYLDKIERMRIMERAGVSLIPWSTGGLAANFFAPFQFPLLARKANGYGGTDIVPVFQSEEIPWRVAAGWDWFSKHIPTRTEYRVWIFRDEVLDIYEKSMKRPEEYKYIGRNFRNGFEFGICAARTNCPAGLLARDAVQALKLDFAAVDLLHGLDDNIYVLEVNTAPGVIRSGAQGTLRKLAQRIVSWEQGGYPVADYNV